METKHGLVMYDVPTRSAGLARKICRSIRKFALMVNKSCYLFPWANAAAVRAAAAETQASVGETCSVYVLPQDPAGEREVLDMAVESARRILQGVHDSLQRRAAKLEETVSQKIADGDVDAADADDWVRMRRAYMLADARRRVEEVQTACFALRIADAVDGWVKLAEKLIRTEEQVLGKNRAEAHN